MTDAEIITIREYFERRLSDLDRIIEQRFASHEKAINLATANLEERLAHLNDLRAMADSRSDVFVTKSEHDRLVQDIRSLEISRAEISGKASQTSVLVGWGLSGIALLLSLIGMLSHSCGIPLVVGK